MPRKYAIEIVKGDKTIPVTESDNISSQRIQDAKWDLMRGRMTLDVQELAKCDLLAKNPAALMKGKDR